MNQTSQNGDKEIYRVPPKDWKDEGYTPVLFITPQGALGIQVGGMAYIKPIETWFHLAKTEELLSQFDK